MVSRVNIQLNGESRPVEGGTTLTALLESLALDRLSVAVERNHHIVPRAEYPVVELEAGDEVEIVTMVGGG